ncbi:unnamed protein product, partial [Heterosigma akashiwo]
AERWAGRALHGACGGRHELPRRPADRRHGVRLCVQWAQRPPPAALPGRRRCGPPLEPSPGTGEHVPSAGGAGRLGQLWGARR